ncbi:AGC/YANK protein kinase [Sphaeroforma arctica JP610]|uniref:AGC/YANK protein kinase n=1 Tax=Sphaeroforma arctica JP610 TaxID=667725 RepID=A0A0L0G5V6_9EUKA|nr:AGC/YANK protein kinase [Sphaeroforma arctica JP610]KNC84221.1 AGC/YANK protein kinase [Sphaeroforma arctica JP610]|eukprot:XP_014158123.1 AGC/YANK protein kinase [Sphaeroforma arctica JP610]
MGNGRSREKIDFNSEVNFTHFKLLRSVGKGAFGKVCIVLKRDTKQLYAMKYMNKDKCIQEKAVKNVLNERKILELLHHPLLVNIWFSFQDEEDMFMVVDLMLGGDLRYHLQNNGPLSETRVRLYMAELSNALCYIHSKGVLHRDIKPDNILMDAEGHVALADFNVATFIPTNGRLVSRAGTRPYMSPEMVKKEGYDTGTDWWSLGVTMYEFITNESPFRGQTSEEAMDLICNKQLVYPKFTDPNIKDFLKGLLNRNPAMRLGSPGRLNDLKEHPFLTATGVLFDDFSQKTLNHEFIPDKHKINCDAMYELEEMILEENPLHKKKQRLKKSKNSVVQSDEFNKPVPGSPADQKLQLMTSYTVFNREKMNKLDSMQNLSTQDHE